MNEASANILSKEIQDYIESHLHSDVKQLALQKSLFSNLDKNAILQQIQSKQKSIDKLPSWYETKNIIYPSTLSIEQTSSETTAQFKASLVTGTSLLDATGGFGVDTYFFSKKINHVWHCEMNTTLSNIVVHNFAQMNINNVTCIQENSTTFLQSTNLFFDWIYIDPARRDDNKNKVFLLEDCEPNIIQNVDLYFSKASNLLIKTAPLLDIQLGLKLLPFVKNIYIVAVQNEVKELLWHLEKNNYLDAQLHAVNISKSHILGITDTIADDNECKMSLPLKYLYEPNNSLLKAGWFKKVANLFKLQKINNHSHLYTSHTLDSNFPGRIFEIQTIIPYQKSNFKSIQKTQANISIRNFPLTVAQIREKHQIKEGGVLYLFFTTDINQQKIIIVTKK